MKETSFTNDEIGWSWIGKGGVGKEETSVVVFVGFVVVLFWVIKCLCPSISFLDGYNL